MKIVFRADASVATGTGHAMRCLTLAEELRDRQAAVTFICRQQPGDLCDLIEQKGFPVVRLASVPAWNALRDADDTRNVLESLGGPADWLVVDHYGIDFRWEQQVRPTVGKIMVIDDLADRRHDCDLLLDQNLYDRMEKRYDGLVPDRCLRLLGPTFALLRREFIEERKQLRSRDGSVKRILVFLGGADSTNETGKALKAFRMLGQRDLVVDVVTGSSNPNTAQVRETCAGIPGASYHEQIDNMAQLMNKADLAIGAGGTTTWERCYLGLPSLSLIVADNQRAVTEAVAAAGATKNLGRASEVDAKQLHAALLSLLNDPAACQAMEQAALEIMRNAGCTQEVAHMLTGTRSLKCGDFLLRPVRESDRDVLLQWRNSDRVRRNMYTDHLISRSEHDAWFDTIKDARPPRIMVLEHKGAPLGIVTISRPEPEQTSRTWGFYLGEETAPPRSGTVLGYLGLEHLFSEPGLQAVRGECFAFNDASRRFHENLGFSPGPRLRKHRVKNGKPEDVLTFTLLRKDWERESDRIGRICQEEGGGQ